MKRIPFTFLILLAIWSCSEDDEATIADDDNTERTFEEAQAEYQELRESFSLPLTRSDGFPQSGVGVYKGLHMGEFFDRNTTADIKLEYFADVEFTLDFETQTFTGELTNFTTNIAGFDKPEGALTVSGLVRNPDEMGGDEFGLRFRVDAGDLTQGDRVASFDAFTVNKGRFLGETGQAVNIHITSLFTWTAGPDEGTVSETIGFMHANRQ